MTAHASGETVLVTISTLAAITTLVVVVRLYTRICLVRNGGIEDWVIVAALLFTIGMSVAIGMQVRYGLGEPASQQAAAEARLYRRAFWFAIWLYHLGIGLARVSVVLQCMRIFPQAEWNARWMMRSMLAINCAFTIWATLSSAFTCSPVSQFWIDEHSDGKCLNKRVLWLVNSSLAMVLDFAVAVLPLPWIKQLHLPLRQKIQLVGLFALAGLPCILAVIRLQALIEVAEAANTTWDNAILALFSANEAYVSIVCASLPSLKAWYNRAIKPRLRSSARKMCQHWPFSSSSSSSRASGSMPGGIVCWIRLLPARRSRHSAVHAEVLGRPWDSSVELVNRPRGDLRAAIHVVHEIQQEVEIQRPEQVRLKGNDKSDTRESEVEHVESLPMRCGVLPSIDVEASVAHSNG